MGGRRRSVGGESAAVTAAGAEVEVSRGGAWYEAVVSRTDARRRRCTVVYSSLFSEKDPSHPLEETVPRSRVRPRPPRGDGVAPRFALHLPVEALHKDGWWPGVVAEVHWQEVREASTAKASPVRYTVCFPAAREAAEFAPAQVRAHLRRARGLWVAPEDHKEVGKADFSVGQLVEVIQEKEDYGAAWYSATVVKVIRKLIFLVEYTSLKADNGKLLREIVDRQYARPSPPLWVETKAFELQDEVEAFYKKRWLPAVVSTVLPDLKYVVRPKYKPEDEIEFDHSKLRPNRIWNSGQWVSISEKKCRTKSKVGHKRRLRMGKRSSSPISLSESGTDDETEHEPRSDISIVAGKNLEKQFLEDGADSPSRKKLKNGVDHLQLPDRKCGGSSTGRSFKTPKKRNLEPDVMDSPSSMSERQHTECQLNYSNHNSTSFSHLVSKSLSYSSPEQDTPMLEGVAGLLVSGEEPCNLSGKNLEYQSETSNIDRSPSTYGTSEHLLLTENESYESFQNPIAKAPQGRMKKLVLRLPNSQRKFMRPHSSEPTATKKRGRPRKMSIQDKNGMELRPVEDTSDEVVEGKHGVEETEESSMVSLDTSQEIHNSGNDVIRLEYSRQIVNDGRDLLGNNSISIHQAGAFNLSNVYHFAKQIDSFSGDYTLIKNLTAQKLSSVSSFKARIEEIPYTAEYINVSNEAETLPLLPAVDNNISTCQKAMSLFVPSSNGSLTKPRALPFVKNSPMWESIESMEVFHTMPQQPHFRSLEKYSMEFREGMAVGLMVTFANVVSNISKISVADPQEKFEEIMRALIPLEEDGFNVESVRSRVEELLEIRSNKKQMENNKEAFKRKISVLTIEKDHLNMIVPALDTAIMEMKQNLTHLCEKRALAIMQGKGIDSEIGKLLEEVTATEEASLLAENRFAAVLASPW